MSSLQKFKAYFGMVPLEDFDDDYLDEPAGPRRGLDDGYDEYDREYDGVRGDYPAGPRGYDDDRYAPGRGRLESVQPRGGSRPAPMAGTRGALAMDARPEPRVEPRRAASLFDESGGMAKITTLRPRDYSEARTIGEQFRDGVPVIMDLVEMSNADAKRLVDFAAGLAFALRGSFDKVATKVFLLSPAEIDVSAEDRRRLVETGFYSK
ncbi:cell division protein SepF [Tomitella cavernea]|uniref:Cell division protein SepF n=2 Tax=Tomitella cavernea TaxID=1387982 RepID=A0ABP9CYV6_9ACTN